MTTAREIMTTQMHTVTEDQSIVEAAPFLMAATIIIYAGPSSSPSCSC